MGRTERSRSLISRLIVVALFSTATLLGSFWLSRTELSLSGESQLQLPARKDRSAGADAAVVCTEPPTPRDAEDAAPMVDQQEKGSGATKARPRLRRDPANEDDELADSPAQQQLQLQQQQQAEQRQQPCPPAEPCSCPTCPSCAADLSASSASSESLAQRLGFKFFVYDIPHPYLLGAIEEGQKREISMFQPMSSETHFLLEVYAAKYLKLHPSYTPDPTKADIFIVPLLFKTFKMLGCENCTNEVFAYVKSLPYYRIANGFDHYVTLTVVGGFNMRAHIPNIMTIGPEIWTDGHGAHKRFFRDHPWNANCLVAPYVEVNPLLVSSENPLAMAEAASKQTRKYLVSFIGTLTTRPWSRALRTRIKQQFQARPDKALWSTLTKRHEVGDVPKLLLQSTFCACPAGDSDSTRRVFSALLAGCIPVILSDWLILPFENFLDWDLLSVSIPEKEPDIVGVLEKIPVDVVREKQQYIAQKRKHFIYHEGKPQEGDAMSMLVDELAVRGSQMRQYRRWMLAYHYRNFNASDDTPFH